MPSLETVSGSGSFKNGTLISFSYSEDATPVEPSKLDGGTGQVNASVVGEEAARGSRVAINNEVNLSDEIYGDVSFNVRQVSINENLVSLIGDTVQAKLNVERTAPPYGSNAGGYTLAAAIYDYCKLAGVDEEGNPLYPPYYEEGLEEKLDLIDVDFIGWQGNLWEHLKMLCAACPVDEDDNTLLEMYVKDNQLWFREGLKTSLQAAELASSESVSISSFDAAQEVTVYKYNTSYKADALVRQEGADNAGFANLENVSITDSMQVSANERIVRRVKINASLEIVRQPVAVAGITSVPYTGVTGEYVIVGKDGLPIQPGQWIAQGGSLAVRLTENPNEIELEIVGANFPELEPFRIGVESSGGEEYPALYITGTGVFFEKSAHTIYTGARADTDVSSTAIDNLFITDDNKLWTRGVAAAQQIAGPSYQLNQELPAGVEFGGSIGSMISTNDTKFRATSISYSQGGASISAKQHVTFNDFDLAWDGTSFEEFEAAMDGLSFDEFSIIPLSKEN
jgi:hypothetical protein